MVLKENELETYISGEVPVAEGDEAKTLHKKNLVKDKKIISDSIKDHKGPILPYLEFVSFTKLVIKLV